MSSTILDLYRRFGVPHEVDPGRGWISVDCPFCIGKAGRHLGYDLNRGYFTCWRCGFHPTVEVLGRLCHVDRGTAFDLWRELGQSVGIPRNGTHDREAQSRVNLSRYRHPSDAGPMRPHHRRYLERRGFDPDRVVRDWGVLGTGPAASLDGVSYRHRLLAPVVWDGREVSFQARDVTGRSDRKYLACPTDRETRHHKYILYGRQEGWGRVGIVVEGITDAWRLGTAACAVFGIKYTPEQVREIARRFKRVAIVFDAEHQAQAQARRLAGQLRVVMGIEPRVVDLGGGVDPGSLAQDDADHLVRELTR